MVTETSHVVDQTAAFAERAFGDFIATITITLASLGDRLGLFKALAVSGWTSSGDLADAAGISERYAREWLSGMACAGYLEHDAIRDRFLLPEFAVPVLADEGAVDFLGGPLEEVPAILASFDRIVESFRTGEGVHQRHYHHDLWEGMQRETASIFNNLLVQAWIPTVPGLEEKLREGAAVADIGCGSGVALIRLAEAYPQSRFVGYDSFPGQLERAIANAEAAGVTDRVRFEVRDAERGLPTVFDVITSFDVVHDAAHPARLLTAIRKALNPGGIYVMVDPAAGETLEDNLGPIGTYLYGASILYCMSTSLAMGGEGIGTAGLPPSTVRRLSAEAGFASVDQVPIEHPLYALFALRA